MSIPIIVNIEAGEKECGACGWQHSEYIADIGKLVRRCHQFDAVVSRKNHSKGWSVSKRLPACLAAEKKIKDLIEAAEKAIENCSCNYGGFGEGGFCKQPCDKCDALRQALAAIKDGNHAE